MGTLTDNLLKLTEFPFSYSLIGLLALIFGQGLNLEEDTLAKLGPLIILMGFVATTLSITDPLGALQRWLLRRGKLIFGHDYFDYIKVRNRPNILRYLAKEEGIPEGFKIRYIQDRTLRTAGIAREIDKITSKGYFVVIISVFISANFVFPSFLDNKLLLLFQEGNQTGATNSTTSDTVVSSSAVESEGTAERITAGAESSSAGTNATNVPSSLEEVNQSTSEVRMHINEACTALPDSDNQDAMTHLELALHALYGASSGGNMTDTAATCGAVNSTNAGGNPVATWQLLVFHLLLLAQFYT
jgi:hypothetical protein